MNQCEILYVHAYYHQRKVITFIHSNIYIFGSLTDAAMRVGVISRRGCARWSYKPTQPCALKFRKSQGHRGGGRIRRRWNKRRSRKQKEGEGKEREGVGLVWEEESETKGKGEEEAQKRCVQFWALALCHWQVATVYPFGIVLRSSSWAANAWMSR